MKDDTISRQAALDALGERPMLWINNDEYTLGARNQYDMDRLAIETLPSAQPSATDTNVATTDSISRAAVVDALEKVAELFPWKVPGNRDSYDRYNEAWNDAIGRAEIEIEKLPSAQQWILYKTRKPKKDGDYFVTYRVEFGGYEELAVTSDYYHANVDEWEVTGSVIAWFPFPEPYKGHTDAD